jgi:filamentous hemagglutinin
MVELRREQARQARAARQADPIASGLDAFDRWMHQAHVPRLMDYYAPDPMDPNDVSNQAIQIYASVPESRGVRPATKYDAFNMVGSLAAAVPVLKGPAAVEEAVAGAAKLGAAAESADVLAGRVAGVRPAGAWRAPGLPPAQAEGRGVPRLNPYVQEHVLGGMTEEDLANVQGRPDEQVIRWGDPIGSHGADVISVNKRTGAVTLWDAKNRTASVRIQQSRTFVDPKARANAIEQARDALGADRSLPAAAKQQALENLRLGRVNTHTVGFGNAKNSVIGN